MVRVPDQKIGAAITHCGIGFSVSNTTESISFRWQSQTRCQRVLLTAILPVHPAACDFQLILAQMQERHPTQSSNDQEFLVATFTAAIEGFNLAKEIMNVPFAKAAFGSVSIILGMIRVRRGLLGSFCLTTQARIGFDAR